MDKKTRDRLKKLSPPFIAFFIAIILFVIVISVEKKSKISSVSSVKKSKNDYQNSNTNRISGDCSNALKILNDILKDAYSLENISPCSSRDTYGEAHDFWRSILYRISNKDCPNISLQMWNEKKQIISNRSQTQHTLCLAIQGNLPSISEMNRITQDVKNYAKLVNKCGEELRKCTSNCGGIKKCEDDCSDSFNVCIKSN